MISFKEKPDTENQVMNILNSTVKKWFFSRFDEFSLPQKYGVTEIHSRNNLLVSAPTGATKTLTGFLSILNELVDSAEKGILEDKIYAVYVSPLKALSNDIEHNLNTPLKEIEKIAGKELGIRVNSRTGDTTPYQRSKMAKTSPHILVTTPESLAIMLQTKSHRQNLREVSWIIVDEIHALAENKRGVHLSLSMEMLQRLSPGICRIGLSATVAPLEDIAQFLVGSNRDCKIINVQFIKETDLKVLSPVKDLINTTHEALQSRTFELIDELIQEHKTTLIFTNTRSGTETIVHHLKSRFPDNYTDVLDETIEIKDGATTGIGAHHGSLSKDHRLKIEQGLRDGKLKAVVCSTSLELGIDIGFIDLVILLGSPKSVARALQRVGRAGHQLHSVTKGRLIVQNRDDLIECSVLLKSALEKKIDKIHIPKNALDVLAQQIYGMCIVEQIHISELRETIKNSYCYKDLSEDDFFSTLKYLSGEYVSLEDRNVYAKIWYDKDTGMLGKKGKLAKIIYMTNIGTIPDSTGVQVKTQGGNNLGMIDESFLEKLKKGDVFVLGGNTYRFNYSRGMTAVVLPVPGKKPTVPSWYSDMLPLSFDLAWEIGKFKELINEKLKKKETKILILKFINEYLYVDETAANAIYTYLKQQYDYAIIPSNKTILVENYTTEEKKYIIFHSMFGRRVNDCLSRSIAYAISKVQHQDVELGITDNGFYVASKRKINGTRALKVIEADRIDELLNLAIDKTQVLNRRFRHCAGRSLMILRTYLGRKKNVGRQQVSSMILMAAVKRISKDFPILKEARREVLEDLMDIKNTKKVLELIELNRIAVKEITTSIPSPFAFNIVLMGHVDIMRMEERVEFLKRMHQLVMAKISLNKGKKGKKEKLEEVDYEELWEYQDNVKILELEKEKEDLMELVNKLDEPIKIKENFKDFIYREKVSDDFENYLIKNKDNLPEKLKEKVEKYFHLNK